MRFQPYTSGSTGRPKGVELSHRAHSWVAETISRDRDFAPSDRMIVAAPLYHKHAMNSIKCVLVGGSTVVLMRKFDAAALYRGYQPLPDNGRFRRADHLRNDAAAPRPACRQ